jgi:hypothetical protein
VRTKACRKGRRTHAPCVAALAPPLSALPGGGCMALLPSWFSLLLLAAEGEDESRSMCLFVAAAAASSSSSSAAAAAAEPGRTASEPRSMLALLVEAGNTPGFPAADGNDEPPVEDDGAARRHEARRGMDARSVCLSAPHALPHRLFLQALPPRTLVRCN